MDYGICSISLTPIRAEASHKAEMVSQLLFGETYEVLRSQGGWMLIKSSFDSYEGWIDEVQYTLLAEKDYNAYNDGNYGIALELACSATSKNDSIPVLAGSLLPFYDGMNFRLGKEKFIYNGQALQKDSRNATVIERIAQRYLYAPYLWGGRSPFGIDCSGFTQVVFRCAGINLLRDAYQQAAQGNVVNFIDEAMPGDLAFFGNAEGKIVHTGIVMKEKRIIHASGRVRVDKLDHFGIFNESTGKYSHQLKIIKRVV
ncbi:MAG TPA: C40 family peptidase [Chitinophagales bacterium]|nr:C40 family peptidase [Chitinophagales bacterium]